MGTKRKGYGSVRVSVERKLSPRDNAALADPKMNARLAELGAAAVPGSPADFGKLLADETEKWAKVVKFARVKAD